MRYDVYTEAYRRDLKAALEQLWCKEGKLPEHKIDDPAKWLDQFEIEAKKENLPMEGGVVWYFEAKEPCTYLNGTVKKEWFPYYWESYDDWHTLDDVIDYWFLPFVVNWLGLSGYKQQVSNWRYHKTKDM